MTCWRIGEEVWAHLDCLLTLSLLPHLHLLPLPDSSIFLDHVPSNEVRYFTSCWNCFSCTLFSNVDYSTSFLRMCFFEVATSALQVQHLMAQVITAFIAMHEDFRGAGNLGKQHVFTIAMHKDFRGAGNLGEQHVFTIHQGGVSSPLSLSFSWLLPIFFAITFSCIPNPGLKHLAFCDSILLIRTDAQTYLTNCAHSERQQLDNGQLIVLLFLHIGCSTQSSFSLLLNELHIWSSCIKCQ